MNAAIRAKLAGGNEALDALARIGNTPSTTFENCSVAGSPNLSFRLATTDPTCPAISSISRRHSLSQTIAKLSNRSTPSSRRTIPRRSSSYDQTN